MNSVPIDPRNPPGWYRVVGVLVALWMLVGVIAWCIDLRMTPELLAGLPDAQRELFATRPAWVFVVNGVAVFSGFAGAIALLARRKVAKTLFLLSVLAAVLQFGYTLDFRERTMGPVNAIMIDRKHGTFWGASSNHGEDHGIGW